MSPTPSREHILATCFSDIPSEIKGIQLRQLSAGSFTLLSRIGNPMIVGAAAGAGDQASMFEAVIEYLWIHSADLDKVSAIATKEQIPAEEIAKLGFSLTFGDILGFLEGYKTSSLRMQAALAEVEDEDDAEGKSETLPTGSPALFLPSGVLETPSGSDTSSGSCPSNEPLPISTLPTSPTAQPAVGSSISPETPVPSPIPKLSSIRSEEDGGL
ncbi:MAG: hypothetical protein ABIT37_01625 [Luteolibacter sp.]